MAVIAERSEVEVFKSRTKDVEDLFLSKVRVGDRVWVKDTLGPDRGCRGTVRFLGSVDFSALPKNLFSIQG